MLTHAQLATVARRAHALIEGEGQGYTQYATYAPRARYVVGGCLPSRIYPVGEAVARMRADMLADSRTPLGMSAHTLGCWEDEGRVYVDFGTTSPDLFHAMHLAEKRGEDAIYDATKGVALPVAEYLAECRRCGNTHAA